MTSTSNIRHYLEDEDSWKCFQERLEERNEEDDSHMTSSSSSFSTIESNETPNNNNNNNPNNHEHTTRNLKHHKHHKHNKEDPRTHRQKILQSLYDNPGIQEHTMHGMMIDAGSTGSRMHVYEFKRRVLKGEKEIAAAVSGRKLSYPGTDTRWTDRLRPGLSEFASINITNDDDELISAVGDYLKPLIEFAETVLHTKKESFPHFPIYLKATAGMRTLDPHNRIRLIQAVRTILHNTTHNPFQFTSDEQARIIAGEEEAIYGWAASNFVLGSLLENSEGSGTVINPKLTHGALEMGGSSTQISFYQPNEDIMSNLFKLQIGQGKHWNVYAHSFLYFGVNSAWERLGAKITFGEDNLYQSNPYHPCLAGGTSIGFQSNIYFQDGIESHSINNAIPSSLPTDPTTTTTTTTTAPYYSTVFTNPNKKGDYDQCSKQVQSLLHIHKNTWCEFAFLGDCSINGQYQPRIPDINMNQTHYKSNFGEFLAFSNYYKVYTFLNLPTRSSLRALDEASRQICEMSYSELVEFNNDRLDEEDMTKMCFMSTYTFQTFRYGYGFKLDDVVSAVKVVKGQKVGWALGSMLYEINTLPWDIVRNKEIKAFDAISFTELTTEKTLFMFVGIILALCFMGTCCVVMKLKRRPSEFSKGGGDRRYVSSSRNGKLLSRRAQSQPNYFSIMEENAIIK